MDVAQIEQYLEALATEREGYVTFEKHDRVAAVDEQIKHYKKELAAAKRAAKAADTEPAPVDGQVTTEDSTPRQKR